MAAVRIDEEAFSDVRVQALAEIAGYANTYEALGRLAHLWRLCTQRQTYVVSETLARACMGPSGIDALLQCELGERTADGIRVKGTEGRIEWLASLRENGKKGGRPKKQAGEPELNQIETRPKPNGFDLQTTTEPEPNPPSLSLAPALANEREIGSDALQPHEVEQLGYPRCGSLAGAGGAAIARLAPIFRHELMDALKTPGLSWKYLAKVIASSREEAAKPKPPPYQGRAGPRQPRSDFREATERLKEWANDETGIPQAHDAPTRLLPPAGS